MKFSITKRKSDSALPVPVKPDIILIYVEDIISMPTTNNKKILTQTEFVLKPEKKYYSLYLTSSEQTVNSNTEGETETRGWIQGINGYFPGTGLRIAEWLTANINQGFVAMRKHCSGTYKIFGSKYNPLFFTGNMIEDKERSITQLEFKQTRKSKVPYILYKGEEIIPNTNTDFRYFDKFFNNKFD